MFDSTFGLFLSLGTGFALVTSLMSWWRVDHGLAEVQVARKDHEKYAKQVDALRQALDALPAEWPITYIAFREAALENITSGHSLMRGYADCVRSHSRHRDIEMEIPEMKLPPALAAPEPPPLPPMKNIDDEKETDQ